MLINPYLQTGFRNARTKQLICYYHLTCAHAVQQTRLNTKHNDKFAKCIDMLYLDHGIWLFLKVGQRVHFYDDQNACL